MSLLIDFCEQTLNAEAPRSFFVWSIFAAMSAVLKRNVYIDRDGLFKTYPNLYVLLIGHSGLGKGLPISKATELVASLNTTRVINGRSSIQSIISELGRRDDRIKDDISRVSAHGFISAPELAANFVSDPQCNTILIDLFDCHYHKNWQNKLKSGSDDLKNICVSMLAASNMPNLKKALQSSDYEGGFLGRCLQVHESVKFQSNSLLRKTENRYKHENLVKELERISKFKGEMEFLPHVADKFDEWKREHDKTLTDDRTGTMARVEDMSLKVATIRNIDFEDSLIMKWEHLEWSIEAVTKLAQNSFKTGLASQVNELSTCLNLVMSLLCKEPITFVPKSRILMAHVGQYSVDALNKVILNLVEMRQLGVTVADGEEYYKIGESLARQWNATKKPKKR